MATPMILASVNVRYDKLAAHAGITVALKDDVLLEYDERTGDYLIVDSNGNGIAMIPATASWAYWRQVYAHVLHGLSLSV